MANILIWDSNHHLDHNKSVVCMLLRRVEMVVSEQSDREDEVKHIKKALTRNVYKKWAFEIPKKREKVEDPSKDRITDRKFPISIHINSGVSEQIQRVFRSHRVPL